MNVTDIFKALGVAVAVIVITMALSFPMVAVYAYLIEPGHPPEFYTEAAQWIAPWSSHILGPICFFGFNYWLARRSPERNAFYFAGLTLILYLLVDFSMLPLMGYPLLEFLNMTILFSFIGKAVGAFYGAHLGQTRPRIQAS